MSGKRSRLDDGPESGAAKRSRNTESELCSSQTQCSGFTTRCEVGIVLEVTIKNFMCHDYMKVELKPDANFIVGKNGSGKSAILTAIIVGLGGKATATNRGTRVNSFIKTGKSFCEVKIKLHNDTVDGYKPEDYGDFIIVERRISKEGGGSYKIMSSTGQTISTKREDLLQIVDHFNIQVDNPVSILTQDTSRNFLNSKNPSDKYKFFKKATQLEQIQCDLDEAEQSQMAALRTIELKESALPSLKQEVKELENKYKTMTCIDELKKKEIVLKNELAWSHIFIYEKDIEEVQNQKKNEEEKIPRCLGKVEQHKEREKEHLEELKKVEEEQGSLSIKYREIEPQFERVKTNLRGLKVDKKGVMNELQKLNNKVESAKAYEKQTSERIKEIQASSQHDFEKERRLREERLSRLRETNHRLDNECRTKQFQKENFHSAAQKCREDMDSTRESVGQRDHRIRNIERNLRNLESSRSNSLIKFGENIPAIIQRIDADFQRGFFEKKPLGPIGAHLKLRRQDWALAMETCLGGLLHSFCTHSHKDANHLEKIFNDVCQSNRHPTIITSKFLDQPHNYRQNLVQTNDHCNAFDLLDLRNPVIINCLLDQRNIEHVIFIKDPKEASRLLINPALTPRNVKEAYSMNGEHMFCRPVFRAYAPQKDKVHFLTSNLEGEIRRLKVEKTNLMDEQEREKNKIVEFRSRFKENSKKEEECERVLVNLRSEITNTQFEIREIQGHEEVPPGDIAIHEQELEACLEKIERIKNLIKQKTSEQTKISNQLEDAEKEHREVVDNIKQLEDQLELMKERVDHLRVELEKTDNAKKHYMQKVKDHEQLVVELRQKATKRSEKLQIEVEKAEQICPRVKTRRTPNQVSNELKELQKKIAEDVRIQGDPEKITREYQEKKDYYIEKVRESKQLHSFINNLTRVLTKRKESLVAIIRLKASEIKHSFVSYLSARNFQGGIEFDHRSESCTIQVHPREVDNLSKKKDMKSLSGGERSFSTVCFILSLWTCVESPFRCLDEFDVFMDMVNRKVSMDLILSYVDRQSNGKQFIFFTPQDMSHVDKKSIVNIYKMPDPVRTGQTRMTDYPAKKRKT